MAQLPGNDVGETTVPVPVGAPPKPPKPYAEPDPSQVGSMLSRLYSGVHRGAHEGQSAHDQGSDG